jgi:hypothetical protein
MKFDRFEHVWLRNTTSEGKTAFDEFGKTLIKTRVFECDSDGIDQVWGDVETRKQSDRQKTVVKIDERSFLTSNASLIIDNEAVSLFIGKTTRISLEMTMNFAVESLVD